MGAPERGETTEELGRAEITDRGKEGKQLEMRSISENVANGRAKEAEKEAMEEKMGDGNQRASQVLPELKGERNKE